MPEHLRALVFVMAIATAVFLLAAKPLTARVMAPDAFARRRNLWFALTLVVFLSHSYWLSLVASALIVGVVGRRESNPAALYCALLFVAPHFAMPVPAFGVINYLFEINHMRMLALVLLLPAAVRLARLPGRDLPRLRMADALFATYFAYTLLVNATADSITGLMRYVLYIVLDHALLYYVVTRSVIDKRRFFDVLACFALAMALAGAISTWENLRSWLLYESLRAPLGVPMQDIGTYLMRETEDGGYLRAMATTGHAIVLGVMSMVALCLHLALFRYSAPKSLAAAVVGCTLLGLWASVSRGPWLAAAIVLLIGSLTGPGAKQRMGWALGGAVVAVAAALLLPQGQKFIDLLPFVGNVDPGSVSYRTLLIDRATIVFWQNPVFGSMHYLTNPALEPLRQGQGIIDIVNTYLGIALAYGAVGLLLFVAPSAYALALCWTTCRRRAHIDAEGEAIGRALATAMLGMLAVIGAASYILHIPIVHWLLYSLCIAYAVSAPSWAAAPARAAASPAGASAHAMRHAGAVGRHRT